MIIYNLRVAGLSPGLCTALVSPVWLPLVSADELIIYLLSSHVCIEIVWILIEVSLPEWWKDCQNPSLAGAFL